jgi:hypothetical protein
MVSAPSQHRDQTRLTHTGLAQAQPAAVILTLFKVAVQIKLYEARIRLHLLSSGPVKGLLHRVTALLQAVPAPAWICYLPDSPVRSRFASIRDITVVV